MPKKVLRYDLEELSHPQSLNELMIVTTPNTLLHIIREGNRTVIDLSCGNRFEVVGGKIFVYEK